MGSKHYVNRRKERKWNPILFWGMVSCVLMSGCTYGEESFEDSIKESMQNKRVSWEDYTGMAENFDRYSGIMENFKGQDLDGDGKEDKLYRIYEEKETENGNESTVGYEIRFGSGEIFPVYKSRDTMGYYVQAEGMDLTGNGKNELVIMHGHGMSTNPEGDTELRIYTYTENGYMPLRLPDGETGKEVMRKEEDGESRIGIPVNMKFEPESGYVSCINKEFGYAEKVKISSEVIQSEEEERDYKELDGKVWSERIYKYQLVTKKGKNMLRMVQQTGFKGMTGDLTYLMSWNKTGAVNVSDITYEPQSYAFGRHEMYEASAGFDNLNLDGDGKTDRAYMNNPEAWKQDRYVEILFGNGERLVILSEGEESVFQDNFKIMPADLDNDGEKEIFLLLNRGSQGGNGEYLLKAYSKKDRNYEELNLPEAFGFQYKEETPSGEADGFCDFAIERNSSFSSLDEPQIYLKLKQYVAGGEGHADLIGYLITRIAYVNGEYKVIDNYFEPQSEKAEE